jgi:hypothetical protein
VLIGASAAVATAAHDGNRPHVNVIGNESTVPSTSESTSSVPAGYESSSAAPTTVNGTTSVVPPGGPNPAPQPADVIGMISVGSPPTDAHADIVADVGSGVNVNTTIWNASDHPIWAANSTVPTALATVCTGEAPGARSMWWMTNMLLAPGDKDARSGTFTPTDAYTGTVTCELDVVTTDQQGTQFDVSAGGDEALATIVARAPGVAQVTMNVEPAIWKITTTGKVGPLQFGVSTAADVIAAAGTPDGLSRATFEVAGRPDFDALGYDCSDHAGTGFLTLHPQPTIAGPYCRTVFFVNVDTGTLAAFETTSNRYETDNGVAVGMAEPDAARLEGKDPVAGCFTGIALGDLSTDADEVFIWVGIQPTDVVTSIMAEGASNQVGLIFC